MMEQIAIALNAEVDKYYLEITPECFVHDPNYGPMLIDQVSKTSGQKFDCVVRDVNLKEWISPLANAGA